MATRKCVKISYKGLTRIITCNVQFEYDELLETIANKFNIDNCHKPAIEFYDEQGHRYNKETFEYFLLLFPNPQKLFFIRLDSSKTINLSNTEDTRSIFYDERMPFVKSKTNIREINNTVLQAYCEAVPVRRQNCFIGAFPDSTTTTTTLTRQQQASSFRYDSHNISLEICKEIGYLKKSLPKKKHLKNPNKFKSSIRI